VSVEARLCLRPGVVDYQTVNALMVVVERYEFVEIHWLLEEARNFGVGSHFG
jgi:hypothetical protein